MAVWGILVGVALAPVVLTSRRAHSVLLAALVASFATATFNEETLPTTLQAALTPARFGVAVLLILFTAHQGRRDARRIRDITGLARGLIQTSYVLALLGFASVGWSVDPARTLEQATGYLILVGLMHVHVCRRWTTLEVVNSDLRVISATLGLILAIGLVAPNNHDGYSDRFYGLMNNPNTLGMIAAILTALALGQCLQEKRLTQIAILAVAVINVVLSGSRTSTVATLLGVAWLIARRGWSTITVAATGMATIGALVLLSSPSSVPGVLQPAVDRFSSDTPLDTFGDRSSVWSATLDLWEQNPFTGYGFRSGESIFSSAPGTVGFGFTVTHSSFLQFVLELGLIGIPVGVTFLLLLLAISTRRPPNAGIAGASALIVAALAIGFTESALWGAGQVFCWVVWLTAAAVASQVGYISPEVAATQRRAPEVAVT